jgi:hypothetical protein
LALKLTEEQAEAIVRLQSNPDYKHVLDALDAYHCELMEHVMYCPEEIVATTRGMARSITEAGRTLSSALDHLKKIRSRK